MNETIKYLRNTIVALNNRIDSLQTINNMERELDNTIDEVTSQLSRFHITPPTEETATPAVGAVVEIFHSDTPAETNFVDISRGDTTHATMSSIDNTSVWSGTDFDSTIATQMNGNNHIETGSQTEISTISDSSLLTTQVSATDETDPTDDYFSDIETLLIGDGTIARLNTNKLGSNLGKIFKIARRHGTLKDLAETTQYYLDKFPKVHTVLFHCGDADMKRSKTDLIKQEYHNITSIVKSHGAKLVISSPIPCPNMSNEAFSRTFAVNKWLSALKKQNGLAVLNNFNAFWKKMNLFERSGALLSTLGAETLAKNITSCLNL